jgi:hypothetical protein
MSEGDATGPSTVRFNSGPVQFHYIKSNDYRVVHVDGAIGSVTPRGLIHAAIYSERVPIPKSAIHPINEDGSLGPPADEDIRSGIVREVEVSLMLDRNTAEGLRNWLTDQIASLDAALVKAEAATRKKAPDNE